MSHSKLDAPKYNSILATTLMYLSMLDSNWPGMVFVTTSRVLHVHMHLIIIVTAI